MKYLLIICFSLWEIHFTSAQTAPAPEVYWQQPDNSIRLRKDGMEIARLQPVRSYEKAKVSIGAAQYALKLKSWGSRCRVYDETGKLIATARRLYSKQSKLRFTDGTLAVLESVRSREKTSIVINPQSSLVLDQEQVLIRGESSFTQREIIAQAVMILSHLYRENQAIIWYSIII